LPVAALAFASAGSAQRGVNSNPVILTDPTGDNGTAPDITSVEVANDDSGYIGVRVGLVPQRARSDVRIVVAIDADENPATGFQGTDYLLIAAPATDNYALARWDGTEFVDAPESTLSASGDENSFTFSVNRSEIGNTPDFNFWVRSVRGPTFTSGDYDAVPNSGTSNYALGAEAPLRLALARSHASAARSGAAFTAYVVVARSDVVLPDVTVDDLACAATVAGHTLVAKDREALGSAAGCLWRLPRRSRGKTLRVTVSVTLDGVTISKRFVKKVT
jgi:hypothetical protein